MVYKLCNDMVYSFMVKLRHRENTKRSEFRCRGSVKLLEENGYVPCRSATKELVIFRKQSPSPDRRSPHGSS